MQGPGQTGPLQWAPALPRTLQVRPEPPNPSWGDSPPRACSSPLVSPLYPSQGEVPADGLPRPQGGDAVVGAHPPAQRYLWHCHPPAGPLCLPSWGVGMWLSMGPVPSPQNLRGEVIPDPSIHPILPFSIVPSLSSLCPPHPSSRLLPAVSPGTIDPAPTRRGSDVVVIASILASLGAVLATAVLGALGYGGLLVGSVRRGLRRAPQLGNPISKEMEIFLTLKKPFYS